jgi:serine/threonine protein kinase
VTGKVPFPGGDAKSKCRRHCEQTPWHPRKFTPDLSEEFVDTIADLMEKDPARRIASAGEVAERLEQWSHNPYETVDRPIDRHAWTPPPPPSEPQQITSQARISENFDEPQTSGGLSMTASDAGAPPVPSGLENDIQIPLRPNHTIAIAIALSVAIPISILIGAIIGFVVRGAL